MKNQSEIEKCNAALDQRAEATGSLAELSKLMAEECVRYETATETILKVSKSFGAVTNNKLNLNLGHVDDFRSRLLLELRRAGVRLTSDLSKSLKPKDDLSLESYVEMRNTNAQKVLDGVSV